MRGYDRTRNEHIVELCGSSNELLVVVRVGPNIDIEVGVSVITPSHHHDLKRGWMA